VVALLSVFAMTIEAAQFMLVLTVLVLFVVTFSPIAALLSTAVLSSGPGQEAKVTRTGALMVAITTGVTLPAAILPAAALRVQVKLVSPATPVQAQLAASVPVMVGGLASVMPVGKVSVTV
jgi:hypothetical protein